MTNYDDEIKRKQLELLELELEEKRNKILRKKKILNFKEKVKKIFRLKTIIWSILFFISAFFILVKTIGQSIYDGTRSQELALTISILLSGGVVYFILKILGTFSTRDEDDAKKD